MNEDLKKLYRRVIELEQENAKLLERVEQLEWDIADIRRSTFEDAAKWCDAQEAECVAGAIDMDPFQALTAHGDALVFARVAQRLREQGRTAEGDPS